MVRLVTLFAFLALAGTVQAATIVGGSDLLSAGYANQLETWLGEGAITLTNIFDATTASTAANFHTAVNGMGRTFSVIEVLGSNQIIGGYDPVSWSSSNDYTYNSTNTGRTAFIFNLSTTTKFAQKLDAPGGAGQYQTYNYSSYGPTFGGGHDIYVDSSLDAGGAYNYTYGPNGSGGVNIVGGTGSSGLTLGRLEVFTISAGAAVPEPAAVALAVAGLAVLVRRRPRARR